MDGYSVNNSCAAGTSIRVLLADDHRAFLERMQRLLDHQPNLRVVGAATHGKDAVRLTQELEPDIVVMDISMPTLNGIDATKEIGKRRPDTKVLCLTVHTERHFLSAMFQAGARGYILKDCPFDELTYAISLVHSGKNYICNQMAHYVDQADQLGKKRRKP